MLTKTEIIIDYVIRQISGGSWQEGDMIPSQQQLVRRFACSRTTVERAVSRLIEAGVLCGRQGSGTYVKKRSSIGGRRQIIVTVPFPESSFGHHPFLNMFFNLDTSNLSLKLITVDYFQDHFADYLDGGTLVIAATPFLKHLMLYDELQKLKVPILMINRNYENFDFIMTDMYSALREGLSWLIGKAGTQIGLITHDLSIDRPYIGERIVIFHELCREFGLDLNPGICFRRRFRENIEEEMTEVCRSLSKQKPFPSAFVITASELVMLFISCCARFGKFCGRDYYILTIDPPLRDRQIAGVGTLCQDFAAFRPEIERWISNMINGVDEPFNRIVKTRLEIC